MILSFRPSYDRSRKLQIEVRYKDIKTLRLRCRPDGTLTLSVPLGCPGKVIDDFLRESEKWIRSMIERSEEHRTQAGEVAVLSQKLRLRLIRSSRAAVIIRDDELLVCAKTANRALSTLDRWWRERLLEVAGPICTAWWRKLAPDSGTPVEVGVRRMRARWGSCAVRDRRVTLNFYLLCAPPRGIEYVALHEVLHFLHADHGRKFKTALAACMPDWRERSNELRNTWSRYIGCLQPERLGGRLQMHDMLSL